MCIAIESLMRTTVNYYDLLKVAPSADAHTIRRAFRTLIRKWHPDCAGSYGQAADHRQFASDHASALIEAYRTLSHPERRRVYDRRRVQLSMAPGTDRRGGIDRRKLPTQQLTEWRVRLARAQGAFLTLAMVVAGTVAGFTLVPQLMACEESSSGVLRALSKY